MNLYSQRLLYLPLLLAVITIVSSCAQVTTKKMEVTAYCGCKSCCGWGRGSWKYLKLDFWNTYYVSGPDKGKPYTGKTASGTTPREYYPGLFSVDSLTHPWVMPFRLLFFPWLLFPHAGTIAADTAYYPFGTRMVVPGYGTGVVEDRGSAIKGPGRIDLFFSSHGKALNWGRRREKVTVTYP